MFGLEWRKKLLCLKTNTLFPLHPKNTRPVRDRIGATHMAKTKLLTVRTTPEQMSKWKAVAKQNNITLSELIISRLNNTEICNSIAKNESRKKLLYEIAKIGNNLNQIARSINIAVKKDEQIQVLETLAEIEKDLNKLVENAN
jgi:hypothetical protein